MNGVRSIQHAEALTYLLMASNAGYMSAPRDPEYRENTSGDRSKFLARAEKKRQRLARKKGRKS